MMLWCFPELNLQPVQKELELMMTLPFEVRLV